ncbi:hypothetical protein Tco_0037773 [Tanacetum coccineum]
MCLRVATGHKSYTSFGDSMLIAFYLAVMIFRICCLAADSGRKVECGHESYTLSAVYDVRGVTSIGLLHESYTSFGDSMLTALYLAVMIFRIWCLAADSGRMAECDQNIQEQSLRMIREQDEEEDDEKSDGMAKEGKNQDASGNAFGSNQKESSSYEYTSSGDAKVIIPLLFAPAKNLRRGEKLGVYLGLFGGVNCLAADNMLEAKAGVLPSLSINLIVVPAKVTWRDMLFSAADSGRKVECGEQDEEEDDEKSDGMAKEGKNQVCNAFGSNQKESSSYEYQQSLMPKGITPVVYLGLFGGVNCLAADNMLEAKVQSQQQVTTLRVGWYFQSLKS